MSHLAHRDPLRTVVISLGLSGAWIAAAFAYTIYDSQNWIPKSFDPVDLLLRAGATMLTVVLLFTFFVTWKERVESFLLPDWGHSLSSALLLAFGTYVMLMRATFELTPATRALGAASLVVGALGMSWFISTAVTKLAAFLRYLRPPPRVNLLGASVIWVLGAPAAAAAQRLLGWEYGLRPTPEMPDALVHLAFVLVLSLPAMRLSTIVPGMRGPSRWLISSLLGGYLAGLTASLVMLADDLIYLPPILVSIWGRGSAVAAGALALPPLLYFSGSTSLLAPSPVEFQVDKSGVYLVEGTPGARFIERLYLSLKTSLPNGRPAILLTRRGSLLDLFGPLTEEAELVIHLSTFADGHDLGNPGVRTFRIPVDVQHVSGALHRLAEVKGAVIILDSLTDLVAVNGHERVVEMLSSVQPKLKSSGAIMFATIFPEAHSESELAEFEMIASEIVDLRLSSATSKPKEEALSARKR